MFTGLVQATGWIVSVRRLQTGVHIDIDAASLPPGAVGVGDSVAVNGVCLTATAVSGGRFGADVSHETLARTAGLADCGPINLETALRAGDRLGGHLVAGHVDGVGTVVRCAPVGESVELVLRAPAGLARYLAFKGSVAVDGVSLTINRVADEAGGCEISINLIPHTVAATTLGRLAAGARVNLEVDLIARYVARILDRSAAEPDARPDFP